MDLTVSPIESKLAQEVVTKYHYLHRKASCMSAYGLYKGNELIGVCVFGKPASNCPCMLFGKDETPHVVELTRLFTADNHIPNKESYFIGKCLKLLPKEYDIVISYADKSVGHTGYIYQATNWTYFGLTDKHVEWYYDGAPKKHIRHFWDEFGGVNEAKKALGDKLQRRERPRKYRYFYLRGNKHRRKYLMSQFRYADQIQPYPKADNVLANDETNTIQTAQTTLF